MNEETRAELVEWLDPLDINCPPEVEDSEHSLSSAMHFLCESEWRSVDEFADEHDCDSEEFRKEAACIIVGHFVDVMLRNECLSDYTHDIIRHLVELCGKELLNG